MDKKSSEEKKQIKLDVKYRIKRGEPKQQILEDLSPLYKDKAYLVRQIETTPSKAMKAKNGIYNYILAVFLFAALVIDVILIFKLDKSNWTTASPGLLVLNYTIAISVVLDTIFLIGVFMYRIEIYSWIASRALVTLLTVILSFGYFGAMLRDANIDPLIYTLVYVTLGLIVISFFLGMFLGVKMCPSRVPKIIEVEIDENEKIKKTIYVFPD